MIIFIIILLINWFIAKDSIKLQQSLLIWLWWVIISKVEIINCVKIEPFKKIDFFYQKEYVYLFTLMSLIVFHAFFLKNSFKWLKVFTSLWERWPEKFSNFHWLYFIFYSISSCFIWISVIFNNFIGIGHKVIHVENQKHKMWNCESNKKKFSSPR